ncbi:MAG TPA: CHAP domain-containing protein [Gaiellaceae bacterium]|jgi:hypothetical protein
MSIADVMSRVAALQALAGASTDPAAAAPVPSPAPGSSTASSFADVLASTTAAAALSSLTTDPTSTSTSTATPAAAPALDLSTLEQLLLPDAAGRGGATAQAAAQPDGSSGAQLLAAAQGQLGVAEQPPGSNDGPGIAVYRAAVEGAQPGQPWCADFASWAAAQAGEPIGDRGQGLGSVAEITSWAASTGRLLPASSTPAPGDLILFGDRHVGVVESVNSDGSLTTVEGNYQDAVSHVTRWPSEATGYVQM